MAGALIGRSRTLRDALIAVAKKYDTALQQVVSEQIEKTIDDLRKHTPIDTGAGAGTTQGAKRNMYKSHPGFGMHIGNNPGDTGWQVEKENDVRRWAIVNPMWVPYLREVNYTHPTHGNFLENAVQRMRQRLNALREVKV
jgi:hypothetical protein